jgi:phosphoribosylformylglycinamidine synthase PurS subunit
MKFVAAIDIMPHKELLDPQGKAVAASLSHIHIEGVADVRIGKHILMTLEAESTEAASATVDLACKKLLANLIMETYSFQIHPLELPAEAAQ